MDEDNSNNGSRSEQPVSRNYVVPSLKSIAEKIRNEKASRKNDANAGKLEDGQEGCFVAKPAKISKLTKSILGDYNHEEEEEKRINKSLIVYEQEQRVELLKILKKFLKCAFTIIIKRRHLYPDDAFQMTSVFGIKVPKFLHPSSLEYVEEVAKKLILFMHRNSTAGCAVHIMIEKNKTMHVVQRFVFRAMGSLDAPVNTGVEEDEVQGLDVTEVKARCRSSLLQLLTTDTIQPAIAPQYSRWSISIGLKKEFILKEDIEQLWSEDPSGNYFPWKKKLRSLANVHSKEDNIVTVSKALPSSALNASSIDLKLENTEGLFKEGNSKLTDLVSKDDESPHVSNKLSKSTQPEPGSSTCNDESKPLYNPNDEAGKTICFPLSSFSISPNCVLSIYGLEYPAPINNNVNNYTFSPRPRSISNGSFRLSQISKHRLLRQRLQ